jgi:hypothetical protein
MSRKHYTRRKGLRQIYRTGARNRDRTSEDEHCGRHQHTAFAVGCFIRRHSQSIPIVLRDL